MIFDWVFQPGFSPAFVCFRKAVRNKIASHCVGQSWEMEVLMKTQQQRWWGVERPKLTTHKGKFALAAAAVEIFVRTRKSHCNCRAISEHRTKQTLCESTDRLEPAGLVGNAKQVVRDGLIPLFLLSPSPWFHGNWVGEQMNEATVTPLASEAKIWGYTFKFLYLILLPY